MSSINKNIRLNNAYQRPPLSPIPIPGMTPNQTTAYLQHFDVVEERERFIDTVNTGYVWSRTFPTLFCPTYYNNEWVIHHDISWYHNARDKHITFDKWIKYQIWREDRLPSKQPTFCRVMYNHKIRSQLQSQDRVVLNTSDIDTKLSANNVSYMLTKAVNIGNVTGIQKMFQRLHTHISRII